MASDAPRITHRSAPDPPRDWGLLAAAAADAAEARRSPARVTPGELPDSEVEDFTVTETDLVGMTQWAKRRGHVHGQGPRHGPHGAHRLLRRGRQEELRAGGASRGELYQRSRDMVARGKVVLQTVEGWTHAHGRTALLEQHQPDPVGQARARGEGGLGAGRRGLRGPGSSSTSSSRDQVRATVQPGLPDRSRRRPHVRDPRRPTVTETLADSPRRARGRDRWSRGRGPASATTASGAWCSDVTVQRAPRRGRRACSGPTAPARPPPFHMIVGLLAAQRGARSRSTAATSPTSRSTAGRGSGSATWRRSRASSASSRCART